MAQIANQTEVIDPARLEVIRGECYRLKMNILNHLSRSGAPPADTEAGGNVAKIEAGQNGSQRFSFA